MGQGSEKFGASLPRPRSSNKPHVTVRRTDTDSTIPVSRSQQFEAGTNQLTSAHGTAALSPDPHHQQKRKTDECATSSLTMRPTCWSSSKATKTV